ncbi:MAG: TMEM175 family protein [Ktedonobacteraceae bacterium]
MIEEKREQETVSEKETGRLEAFSDGVFAVAITILVFDLKVPITTPSQLVIKLFLQWPSYITFFISFATILIMWVSHHSMFKLIHKSSSLFMFANGFLLLLVTIVPFTSQLASEYLTSAAAATVCAVYAGLFMVINIAYNLLWWSAAYQHCLLKANVSRSLIKTRTRNYLLGFPSYLLAMVLAFWSPLVSIGICSILWLFWAFTNYEREPVRKQQGAEQIH